MPFVRRFAVVLMGTACGAWASAQPAAEPSVFTAEQASAGKTAFQAHCATCHAGDLRGKDDAPALNGDAFLATWQAKPVKELFDFVRTTMPLTTTTSTLISAVLSRPKPQFARN